MKSFLFVLLLLAAAIASLGWMMTYMPGEPFRGAPPAASDEEERLARSLRTHVETLGRDIGTRGFSHSPDKLAAAADYLEGCLRHAGLIVEEFEYNARGKVARNLIAEVRGRNREQVILVGAHFDSGSRTPGADDNASGCAVVLEIAAALAPSAYDRTVRFVFFSNGAEPWAGGPDTGSRAYAHRCVENKEKVLAMLSLDSLGAYQATAGSQSCPFPLSLRYPDQGNFVAFVGDFRSRDLVTSCLEKFRLGARFPSEGLVLPGWFPGIDDSDDGGFRAEGFPALRVTDTGTFRHEHCGRMSDTPDRLDYLSMARVTAGLARVVADLGMNKTELH